MKDLRAIRGKFYIADLIAQGEHQQQDFKFQISDAMKIARSLSAFANCEGGRLLIGVKDNGVIAGVRSEEDIYMIEQAAQMYCRPAIEVRFTAFRATDEGHVVIRAEVDPAEERPVKAREHDGRWRAYFRVADENIAASPLMVRAWEREKNASSAFMAADGLARHLFDIIAKDGHATVESLMKTAHASRLAAEDIIVELAAMKLVKFHWDGAEFVVVASEIG